MKKSFVASALVSFTLLLQQTASAAEEKLTYQSPLAETVGTTTNLQASLSTLLDDFDQLAEPGKGFITLHRLREIAQIRKNVPHSPDADAARFLLASPFSRHLAGNEGRDEFTKTSLRNAIAISWSERVEATISRREEKSLDMVLRDPALPQNIRSKIIAHIPDQALLHIVGQINAEGSEQDKKDETMAFLYLARLSWLGYVEASTISKYQVPYTMMRGSDDHSASFWDGKQVRLSEKMLSGGTGIVNAENLAKHIGIFAHESGHAISHFAGLERQLDTDCKANNLTPGACSVIGEAVAGVLQNRAHVAAQGYEEKRDANLMLIHDVEQNLENDQAFYARYYHVDTAKARAQLPQIEQILANDVAPFFEDEFGLLGDPQLTQMLPDGKR